MSTPQPKKHLWSGLLAGMLLGATLGAQGHTIDPTVKDQQFCDHGSPYRTAIFGQSAEQLKIAQASRAVLEKSKPFKEPIVTELVMAGTFYPADDYHQDYYKKNPIRYKYYRASCGRDARLQQLWGNQAGH